MLKIMHANPLKFNILAFSNTHPLCFTAFSSLNSARGLHLPDLIIPPPPLDADRRDFIKQLLTIVQPYYPKPQGIVKNFVSTPLIELFLFCFLGSDDATKCCDCFLFTM